MANAREILMWDNFKVKKGRVITMTNVKGDRSRTTKAKANTRELNRQRNYKAMEQRIYLSEIVNDVLQENHSLAEAYAEYRNEVNYEYCY